MLKKFPPLTAVLLWTFLCANTAIAGPSYYEYNQESRDMKLTGRVYHVAPGKVVIEAWPRPRKLRPQVDRIELISPSGKRYKVSQIENIPMSQVQKKRSGYEQLAMASVDEWFCGTAYADEEDERERAEPHEDSHEESRDEVSQRDAETFAAFGMLAGMASQTEKEWIAAGHVAVEEEPGVWKANITVEDEKHQKHDFTVSFELSKIGAVTGAKPANDREVTMISWTDPETGLTTTEKLNPDGSKTITVTDKSGHVVSTTTRPPFRGSTRTFMDPKTGLRITETDNGDGSVTRRAEDNNGNWSEGHSYPGGKKKEEPPASTPEPEPASTPKPEPEPTPTTPEEPGLPLPPQATPHTQERDNPQPTTPTGPAVSILDEIEQGEEKPPTVYGEEMGDKVGILLVRDDDEWLPKYGNRTGVTAKIYEPDPTRPKVWLPSKTKKRVITVKFAERSKEKGKCMNVSLDEDPQDSPDLFLKQDENPDATCTDDALSGRGFFNSCTTKREMNTFTAEVSSEDYGSFSKMEATCPDCVPLIAVYRTREQVYPVAVEEPDREKRLITVPSDWNKNQIADGYPPEKKDFESANEDSDRLPIGNGTPGDGLTAYEEYRGFFDKYGLHHRTDTKKKTLFIQNNSNLPGIPQYETATGLEVFQIDSTQHKDRVINFNSGNAHEVDQHCLILKQSAVTGNGLLGYTETDFGSPKHTQWVEIYPGNHKSTFVPDTVVHELGHAIGIRHHGDTGMWEEEWVPPGSWHDYNPFGGIRIPGTDINVIARASKTPTLCGINLPETIPFGEKHNQSSGMAECYMRYEYQGIAFYQEDGTIECLGRPPAFTGFCSSPTGTAFNAGNHAAGHATVGNCLGQFVINDKE